MQHSPRPRRFRKTAAAAATAAGYTTAADLLGTITTRATAERYAAQITMTARQIGAEATATTYVKANGRARAAAAYDVERDAVALFVALATYRPSLSATVTKTGKPSKSKAAEAQRAAHAAYVREFEGRTVEGPARVAVAA